MKVLEHDDFEIILRRIMCIFFCIESVMLFNYIISYRDELSYFFHDESFTKMFLSDCSYIAVPALFSVLSLFFKSAYFIIEIVHVVSGLYCLSWYCDRSSPLTGIMILMLLSGRLLIYYILMKRHKKHISHAANNYNKVNDDNADIEKDVSCNENT